MRMRMTFCWYVVVFAACTLFSQGAQAQGSVLDFFSNELDLSVGQIPEGASTGNNDPAPPGASISELFGDSPSAPTSGAVAPAGAAVAPVQNNFDPKQVEKELKDEAFSKALEGMLPLNSEQIRRLLEEFDRTQESYELPVYPLPKPEMVVKTISLDPGAKPVTIRVAQGHVTTLNMLDVTGGPWPIEDITWAGNFNIIQSGDTESGVHFVRITPQSEFAYGNMSIKMLGLKTPIVMTIETSRDLVHYRFDAIVPDYGPMAEAPLIEGGVSLAAGNPAMSSVLQGIIPSGARRMAVSGTDGRTTAYRYAGAMYVRTPLSLLSPSWTSSVASADGMRVYTVKQTPVLLLSDNGRMVRANVSLEDGVSN